MKAYRVSDYRAYATTAMRGAKNSHIILEQIRVRTGISVKIVSNSEQRLLTYKAIAMKEAEFQKLIAQEIADLEDPERFVCAYDMNQAMVKMSLIFSGEEEGVSNTGDLFTAEELDFSSGGER